ncbi:hypothetical protein DIS24_g10616 [Lasiodiplodia hormozganensis]|uniref:Uncharacterized protein n=1 Tax=Lasiodiplodia hormozganensis TaxID=869390 RepID=A0AA39XP55_9PEZI|nr:hypothetical protein DIS24_g10616 [Lasiodiplodia hormozganensis]
MLAAQLLVGMIGDSSKILFPYHELRRKLNYTTANLFEDPLSKVTAHALCSSIRLKQYALVATGFSMLLTPFLTIVSSGLFSPEPTTRTYDSIFRLDNVLNTSTDLAAAMTKGLLGFQSRFHLNLILANNLSYPEWTYGELAFHEMTIDTIKDTDNDLSALYPDPTGLTIHATVPAIRAALDCTYVPPDFVDIFNMPGNTQITVHTAAQLSLPKECRNQTLIFYSGINEEFNTSQPFAWFGSDQGNYHGECAHTFAAFGSSLHNGSAQVMACVPVVEQVQTDTIFSLPSHRIVSATTKDTTAVPIANMTAAIFLDMWLPGGPFSSDTSATDGGNYDRTFTILLGAPGFVTLEIADFDAANAAHAKIAAAVQHLFALAYVQGLTLNARSKVPASASTVASGNISMPTMLEGQIVDPRAQMRLKQSAVSTRILEGLLGAIAVCLLVSFWLLETRKVIPEDVCSIAVAASLLAGADMLRGVPRGAEWWNDDEAVKKEVFGKDAVFSLGWWVEERQDREIGEREGNTGAVVERNGSGEARELRRRRFGIDRGRASWD